MTSPLENNSSNSNRNENSGRKSSGISIVWEGRLAKSGWVLIHILIYSLLAFRDSTDLNIAFKNHDYFYLIWTHSIFFFTILFYFLSSINPGHVKDFMKFNQTTSISNNSINNTSISNSKSYSNSDGEGELKYRNNSKKDSIESIPLISVNNDKEDGESSLMKDEVKGNEDEEEDDEINNLKEKLFGSNYYCNICEIDVPIRCKHCKRCNQCIVKYDHHCFFIGRCIGIRNHFYFWLFLLSQAILLGLGFQIATTGFRTGNETWMDWVWANIIMISPSMLIFGSFFMPAGLFFFHTYLMLTNQTSWEFTKHEKITYLQGFYRRNANVLGGSIYTAHRQYPYPFSKGIVYNIKEFLNGINETHFTKDNNGLDELPSTDQLEFIMKKKKDTFSIWNNKYYSCFG